MEKRNFTRKLKYRLPKLRRKKQTEREREKEKLECKPNSPWPNKNVYGKLALCRTTAAATIPEIPSME